MHPGDVRCLSRSRYESEYLDPTEKAAQGYRYAVSLYESLLDGMFVRKEEIGEFSALYVIEDSLIVVVSLDRAIEHMEHYDQWGDPIKTDWVDEFEFSLVIEELTYNNVFKFNFSKFRDRVVCDTDLPYEFVDFRRFTKTEADVDSKLDEVDRLFPALRIRELRNSWDGVNRNFVIFECFDGEMHGIAVASTNQMVTASKSYDMVRDVNNLLISRYALRDKSKRNNAIFDAGISFRFGHTASQSSIAMNKAFQTIAYSRLSKMTPDNLSGMKVRGGTTIFMARDLTMSIVTRGVKDLGALSSFLNEQMLKAVESGMVDLEGRTPYEEPESRWRQEELMVKCVSSVFGASSVIPQFKPSFLGRQSYDAYVKGKKIAFEYQGVQHFEPVGFFGGDDGFDRRIELDKRKKELSDANGVTLVYVNYWEEINDELIRSKVREAKRRC